MLSRPGEVRLTKRNKGGFVPEMIQVVQKRKEKNLIKMQKPENEILTINIITVMRHTEQITQC